MKVLLGADLGDPRCPWARRLPPAVASELAARGHDVWLHVCLDDGPVPSTTGSPNLRFLTTDLSGGGQDVGLGTRTERWLAASTEVAHDLAVAVGLEVIHQFTPHLLTDLGRPLRSPGVPVLLGPLLDREQIEPALTAHDDAAGAGTSDRHRSGRRLMPRRSSTRRVVPTLQAAQRLLAATDETAQTLQRLGFGPVTAVIPPVHLIEGERAERPPIHPPGDRLRVLWVDDGRGRPSRSLVQAAVVEAERRAGASTAMELILARLAAAPSLARDSGDTRSPTRSHTLPAGEPEQMLVIDDVGPDRLHWLLRAADVVVSTALAPGGGDVIALAMGNGRPVVALDHLEGRRLLGGGGGVLVPLGRPGELAGALAAVLVDLAADPDRRRILGAAAWDRSADYTVARLVDDLEKRYEQLAARRLA